MGKTGGPVAAARWLIGQLDRSAAFMTEFSFQENRPKWPISF